MALGCQKDSIPVDCSLRMNLRCKGITEGGEMEEDPLGEHYLIELYECEKEVLNNLGVVTETMQEAARLAGATIIDERFHRFSPQGVSGVVVIAESHLSIHTWPELGYAALDLFTCNHELNIHSALDLLRQTFQTDSVEVRYLQRGILNPENRDQVSTLQKLSITEAGSIVR